MPTALRNQLSKIKNFVKLNYYWFRLPSKICSIRKKESIRVLFVISEPSCWKTELLFQEMLNHPRFDPILGVSTMQKKPDEKQVMISYLKSKGYLYKDLDSNGSTIEDLKPDIIFYYKPYSSCYTKGHFFNNHLKHVFCGLDYCFRVTKQVVHIEKEMFDYCWQFYVENPEVAARKREVLGYKARNVVVSGVPMQDILIQSKERFDDPWKDRTGKKRIIYAPHHSIQGTNGEGIEFATFLFLGGHILELAKKYRDQVTFAFKPHPNLYLKLLEIWGKERTDSYYKEWESLPNAQIETGEYVGLFKYSDAIIHDCASFIVEYLYMDNPSMYLVADTNDIKEMFDFVQKGFYCYQHGKSLEDIEEFIQDVIEGIDRKKEERKEYINHFLLPPDGKTACNNIINSIIGA